MSSVTPIKQDCSHKATDALDERRSNRLRHIVNIDEQIAMLNGSGVRRTSHPDDDGDHLGDTRAGQDGDQAASQANCNGTTTVAKTSPVLALLHSNTDKIKLLHASLINLQAEINAQWDHYYGIHRNLPSYDVGLVTRPQLCSNRGSNSLFKGCSSPPLGIPKPATPRTLLRILPTHPLTESGVVSLDDCQHMYEAGVSGKHDELKDVYFAVANAPGYQSHGFDGNKLHPMQQHPPRGSQGFVDIHNEHSVMLGMTDRLWQAEPETSLKGPQEKWGKETIGDFPPAVENRARKTRVYEDSERFAMASAAVAEALGVEEGHRCPNGSPGGVTSHQMAMYGNSEDFNGHGQQANGDHRGVNGGSQSTASTPPDTNGHYEDDAEDHNHMSELFRNAGNARPSTKGPDSAIPGAHEILNGDYGLRDGIQDDHTTIIVVHYRDTDSGSSSQERVPCFR